MADDLTQQSENSPPETVTTNDAPDRSARAKIRRILILVVLVCLFIAGRWFWSIQSGLANAKQFAKESEWTSAVVCLEKYLSWYPGDAEAHLLMAEGLLKRKAAGNDAPVRAIRHLSQIAESSPLAARARLQEGRLNLFALRKPGRAETLLKESLALDANSFEANYLMWKLLDVTGRHIFSRDYFWQAYESSSESERPVRLREWFLSEFYPETANAEYYKALGAQPIKTVPASITLMVLLRESEPEAPFLHAGIARYYLDQGNPDSSLEILKGAPDLAAAMRDPFFVSVLLRSLVDLGESEKAKTCFESYPTPPKDYLYWRVKAIFEHNAIDDPQAAIISYNEALTKWPAKFDWRLKMKLAECLRKSGQGEEATKIQDEVDKLTKTILTPENTSQLRDRLENLSDPTVAEELSKLYTEFELLKEANAWSSHFKELTRNTAPAGPNVQN